MDKDTFNNLIIRIVENKDKDAFQLIYNEYADKIVRTAFFIVRDKYVAEFVLSDVMIKFVKGEIKPATTNPSALINKITKNIALNYKNKIDLERSRNVSLDVIAETVATSDDISVNVEFIFMLNKLEDEERKIVMARVIDKSTYEEISSDFDMSQMTALRTYNKALGKIKIEYEKREDN
ncbi:MAG: RNA polymerase sigma factor [Firmicutes bacterium]|nr:RNA polymerase sigma factor [Bacillota bacterium]